MAKLCANLECTLRDKQTYWLPLALEPPSLKSAGEPATRFKLGKRVNRGGIGWRHLLERAAANGSPVEAATAHVPLALTCIVALTLSIYGALFATRLLFYGKTTKGTVLAVARLIGSIFLWRSWALIVPQVRRRKHPHRPNHERTAGDTHATAFATPHGRRCKGLATVRNRRHWIA